MRLGLTKRQNNSHPNARDSLTPGMVSMVLVFWHHFLRNWFFFFFASLHELITFWPSAGLWRTGLLKLALSSSQDQKTQSLSLMQTLFPEKHTRVMHGLRRSRCEGFNQLKWTCTQLWVLWFSERDETFWSSQKHSYIFSLVPLSLLPTSPCFNWPQPPNLGEKEQSHILTHTKFVLDYGGQLCFHSRSWFISPWIGLNELLDNSWDQP